jgi:hypothetical protein
MIGGMASELEELLALHNRILQQCWQAHGRLDQAAQLQAHVRGLEAAGHQLRRIFLNHADTLEPEVRREAVRTLARLECFLEACRNRLDSSSFVR